MRVWLRAALVALVVPSDALRFRGTPLASRPRSVMPSKQRTFPSFAIRPHSSSREKGKASEKHSAHTFPLWIAITFYAVMISLFIAGLGFVVYRLYVSHQGIRNTGPIRPRMSFRAYASYRFEYWFDSTDSSTGIVLSLLTAGTLIIGSLLYLFLTRSDIETSMWLTFVWIVCPDAGNEEKSTMGAAVGAFLSICGLILFALLLTMVQDSFATWLESHRTGAAPIIESGHVVLIGLQQHMIPVIPELCKAHEEIGGTTICVLAGECTKEEMEIQIAGALGDYPAFGSKVVVRSGKATNASDLKRVAADTAKQIILLPRNDCPKEMKDAILLRTIISLRGNGWPIKGRILVSCSLPRNKVLFKQTGGTNTDIVMFDNFVAKMMVQGSRHWGLGEVMSEAFSSNGAKFAIAPVPQHLVGKTILYAAYHYPSAVVCGIGMFPSAMHDHHLADKSNDTCSLCPRGVDGKAHTLKKEEYLILYSHGTAPAALESPCTQFPEKLPLETMVAVAEQPMKEKVLFMGFNHLLGKMIYELDQLVAKGSEVVIASPLLADERLAMLEISLKRLTKERAGNITTIKHLEVNLGSRYAIEDLGTTKGTSPLQEISRIFVISDEAFKSVAQCDTSTIATILQIRDSLSNKKEAGENVCESTIMPQIQLPSSAKHLQKVRATDFVNTSELPCQIIGMMVVKPYVQVVIGDIVSEDGHVNFFIRQLADFMPPSADPVTQISFLELTTLASAAGEVAVGWSDVPKKNAKKKSSDEFRDTMSQLVDAHDEGATVWAMNPKDKVTRRPWTNRDRIVVLAPLTGG